MFFKKLTTLFPDVNMEVAAVNEDDGEPAKAKRPTGEEVFLEDKLDQLSLTRGQFTIVIDGHQLVCDENVLVRECKYFEAFAHFEESRRIDIKGGLDFNTFKAIVDFLGTKSLVINLENCQVVFYLEILLEYLFASGYSACLPLSAMCIS